jgi:hypothetical protein
MALAPIGELFRMKHRPETVLEVNRAIDDPDATVRDYVFTDNLRNAFETIFSRVERGRGQGYWIRAQYGGGKTHFLATIASLLSGGDTVWNATKDTDIAAWRSRLKDSRLFPLVFSLRGKSSVEQKAPLSLYDVFEEEIKSAAEKLLNLDLSLSTSDEVLQWWEKTAEGTRGDIDAWVRKKQGRSASELRGDHEAFKDAVLDAAIGLGFAIRLAAKTEDRLQTAYRQLVNPKTGYTGILVIIDEFAFWQGQRPENTAAGYQDEEFLETIGAILPQARGLQYTVIVASQQAPPVKLQDPKRYQQFLVAPGDEEQELWDYQQVVSHRVRELVPDRVPEIEEYHQEATAKYSFGSNLSPVRFSVMFPVEPTTYRILQRITASLASERVGINVLWEVLGIETPEGAEVRTELLSRRRLITAPALLSSPSLQLELADYKHKDRLDYLEAARDGLEHCDLDDDEKELARDILETLFLWGIAHLNVNKPMSLNDLTPAVLAEQGIYNNPQEAVASVLNAMSGLEQIGFDPQTASAEFLARAAIGKPAQQVFSEYKSRPLANIDQEWRKYLLDAGLSQDSQTALFAGKTPGAGEKIAVLWGQVEYEGRQVLSDSWKGELGAELNQREEGFFRIVYLIEPSPGLGAEAIQHDRVAVCVPRVLTDGERNALKDVVALAQMERDYSGRSDDEALRVQDYVKQQRSRCVPELIHWQRERYRGGKVITRSGLNVDPADAFQNIRADRRAEAIASRLMEHAFKDRPFGKFRGMAPFAGNVAQFIFQALFRGDTAGKARDAATNYAPALALSDSLEPTRLTGDTAQALEMLRTWLNEASDQSEGVAAWKIYDRFASRGVPVRMTTLFILAFLRRASERAEMVLRANAKLALDGRHQLPQSLTATDVPLIGSFTQVADGSVFDQLVRSRQVSWGDAIGWLRAVDETVKPTNSPDDVASQDRQVVARAHQLSAGASQALEAVRELGRALNEDAPAQAEEALQASAELGTVMSFVDIFQQAQRYETEAAFGQAMRRAREAGRLALEAGPIRAAIGYLQALAGILSADLQVERNSILSQMTLGELLEHDVWARLQHDYAAFKTRYRTQYLKFHRDYMRELSDLATIHANLGLLLVGVERLQQIPALDGGSAASLRRRWEVLASELRVCPKSAGEISVDAEPVCSECRTRFGTNGPGAEVHALQSQVSVHVQRVARVFKAATVQRVLAELSDKGDAVAIRLAHAVALDDEHVIAFVAENEASVPMIGTVLLGMRLRRIDIGSRLRERYATVTTENLEEVTAYFRSLLEGALHDIGKEGQVELE